MKPRFPLFTERLQLRPIIFADLEVIHQLHTLPETDRFNTLGIPKNKNETEKVIAPWIVDNQNPESNTFTFAIESKKSLNFIGLIAIKSGNPKYKSAEVWYKLHPDHWRKGFATESLKEIIRFGFNDLKLHRIEAGCAVENIASIKVIEKAGMLREGRKRKVLPLKTGWADNFEYAVLDSDR